MYELITLLSFAKETRFCCVTSLNVHSLALMEVRVLRLTRATGHMLTS